MFGWLFRQSLRREEVIRIATQFALAKWEEYTADWPEEEAAWRYDFESAALGGNYWYVRFKRRPVEGVITSDHGLEVWVHKLTGEVDYGDKICERDKEQELKE